MSAVSRNTFFGLYLIFSAALATSAVKAQTELSTEEITQYFGIYERLRLVTGEDQPFPVLLVDPPGLIIWAARDRKVRAIRQEGASAVCTFDRVELGVLNRMLTQLDALSGPTFLADDAEFGSLQVNGILRGLTGDLPTGNCRLDVYESGSAPIGVMTPGRDADARGPLTIFVDGVRYPVTEANRSWFFDDDNRRQVATSIPSFNIRRIVAIGDVGMVAIDMSGALFFVPWSTGNRIEFVTWTEAQSVIDAGSERLFPDAVIPPSGPEQYEELVGSLAEGPERWESLIRQAPQIVFRRW